MPSPPIPPAGAASRPAPRPTSQLLPSDTTPPRALATVHDEDGSMTTEYGLIVVVGATAVSLVIKWASGGAIFELLGGVLDAARGLVGF